MGSGYLNDAGTHVDCDWDGTRCVDKPAAANNNNAAGAAPNCQTHYDNVADCTGSGYINKADMSIECYWDGAGCADASTCQDFSGPGYNNKDICEGSSLGCDWDSDRGASMECYEEPPSASGTTATSSPSSSTGSTSSGPPAAAGASSSVVTFVRDLSTIKLCNRSGSALSFSTYGEYEFKVNTYKDNVKTKDPRPKSQKGGTKEDSKYRTTASKERPERKVGRSNNVLAGILITVVNRKVIDCPAVTETLIGNLSSDIVGRRSEMYDKCMSP